VPQCPTAGDAIAVNIHAGLLNLLSHDVFFRSQNGRKCADGRDSAPDPADPIAGLREGIGREKEGRGEEERGREGEQVGKR